MYFENDVKVDKFRKENIKSNNKARDTEWSELSNNARRSWRKRYRESK